MTDHRAFLLGIPVGTGVFLYALLAPAFRHTRPVVPVGEPRRPLLNRGAHPLIVIRALAWRCDRCTTLTVRLDSQPAALRCDRCAGPVEPFPLRAKTEEPEAP